MMGKKNMAFGQCRNGVLVQLVDKILSVLCYREPLSSIWIGFVVVE